MIQPCPAYTVRPNRSNVAKFKRNDCGWAGNSALIALIVFFMVQIATVTVTATHERHLDLACHLPLFEARCCRAQQILSTVLPLTSQPSLSHLIGAYQQIIVRKWDMAPLIIECGTYLGLWYIYLFSVVLCRSFTDSNTASATRLS